MARLHLSHNIRNYVKTSIDAPFRKRIEDLHAAIRNSFNADVLFAQLVGPELMEHMKALPVEFLSREERFYAKLAVGDKPYSLGFTLSVKQPVPHAWTKSWETQSHRLIPPETPGYDKAMSLVNTWINVENERSTLISTIDKLLSKCSTVQQVAKVWPGVVQHLNAKDLTKYNERPPAKGEPPKKKAREALPAIPDDVAVSLAKVAMLKGGAP